MRVLLVSAPFNVDRFLSERTVVKGEVCDKGTAFEETSDFKRLERLFAVL